jgi:Tol biopolymer transport system component
MRAKLSTVALVAVVGGVVAAAAIDSLTGHSASRSRVTDAVPTQPATGPPATPGVPGPAPVGGTIVFGRHIESGSVLPGLLVVTPDEPGPQVMDVGIRSARSGGRLIRVTAERLRIGPGVGTPSGERIAVWAWNPSRPALDGIYARDAAGGALGRVTSTPRGRLQQPLAFSPDGARLLFYQARRDHRAGSLYVVQANGADRIRVTPRGMTSWCCSLGSPADWGPDGQIAFAAFAPGAAGRDGESAVYVANADGSHPRRITPMIAWATTARWSPDGRWIAFDHVKRPGGAHDLFLVHPDGTGLRMIPTATGDYGSCCARWSVNSRSLIYASGPSNRATNLWIVNIDGSGARELTHDTSLTEQTGR